MLPKTQTDLKSPLSGLFWFWPDSIKFGMNVVLEIKRNQSLFNSLFSACRDEDDGCQLVEAAVTGRTLSTRSRMGQPTSARCPRDRPISNTTRRRAGDIQP